jgi:hypothetical protein
MKPNQLIRRLEALEMNLAFNEAIVLQMPDGRTETLRGHDAVCLLGRSLRNDCTPEMELIARSVSSSEAGQRPHDLPRAGAVEWAGRRAGDASMKAILRHVGVLEGKLGHQGNLRGRLWPPCFASDGGDGWRQVASHSKTDRSSASGLAACFRSQRRCGSAVRSGRTGSAPHRRKREPDGISPYRATRGAGQRERGDRSGVPNHSLHRACQQASVEHADVGERQSRMDAFRSASGPGGIRADHIAAFLRDNDEAASLPRGFESRPAGDPNASRYGSACHHSESGRLGARRNRANRMSGRELASDIFRYHAGWFARVWFVNTALSLGVPRPDISKYALHGQLTFFPSDRKVGKHFAT